MRTALILSLLACASLSLPIWQLSRTSALRSMAARLRTTWKLLPEASSTKRSWAVVYFLAQLWSWDIGTLLNIFSVTAAAGVGPRSSAAVKVSGWESKRITRLHALRYAGRSPCRCFSPVLIHENGELLQASFTSIFRNPPAG